MTVPGDPFRAEALRDLRVAYPPPPWHLRVLPEGEGNRVDESQLTVIGDHLNARALRISGLDQATFERLIVRYGAQFSAVEFAKCPRIADLRPLEDLPDLQFVSLFWNQQATRIGIWLAPPPHRPEVRRLHPPAR